MKNVIVFALGGGRFALELRWVREVFTLGPVTPVPTAPDAIAGAVNYRGAIVPVLWTPPLLEAAAGLKVTPVRAPAAGESAILLDVEDFRAALAVDRIDEVTTLTEEEDGLIDPRGRLIPLLDPPGLLEAARRLVGESAGISEGGP